MLEMIHQKDNKCIASVLFDFDGTLSTLRCGWEQVMQPMMAEVLLRCGRDDAEPIHRLVEAYIDESTGIQTILQMKWLAGQVAQRGVEPLDPWVYKDEYNRRLMASIEHKKARLRCGKAAAGEYLVAGGAAFLKALNSHGASVYVASGTDHADVVCEARLLGVYQYFTEICGAPVHEESCSKEAVLRRLMADHSLCGRQLAVVGDGKVEITLGKNAGALTVGVASDELARQGVNPVKRRRLLNAGADVICGDFLCLEELLNLFGMNRAKEGCL